MGNQSFSDGDRVASDDMEEVLEYTRHIQRIQDAETRIRGRAADKTARDLRAQIAESEAELLQFDEDIAQLTRCRNKKAAEVEEMKKLLRARAHNQPSTSTANGINYHDDKFDWDKALQATSQKYFNIKAFRLCQQGVCNANMDGRDIVCVMPTGGGKSLTYQLPALLTAGCTLIISPLIALIEDQVMNLSSHGVEAVMLLGATKQAEKREIMKRLGDMADGTLQGPKEIKLCYVTPEKLVKDKSFLSLLHQLYAAGKLARFVLDEAHCVSSYGHDFRPDYGKLHLLKTSFPRVPIMALSATCPPKVLEDLVKILRLPPVVGGQDANTSGTVYFTAPLYRKNLLYKILPKPAKGEELYKAIVDYIMTYHRNDSGIIYCFSQKDSQTCAEKVQELSGNKIRTGTYHADVKDDQKRQIHEAWRDGRVQVVCATIAFGLGIDKGDVRFVIHHQISKSIEGYYQESGRAGRDGKDADCILYYRPQDASHLSGLISINEKDGQNKLHDLLNFVEDVTECRKIQFANYFSHSWQLSINSWTTEESNVLERCGHCDNCMRVPGSVIQKDVTLAAWQILRVVAEVQKIDGKLTLNMLASLARGKGGSKIDLVKGKGRGKAREKVGVDLERVCGGPVEMSSEEVEHLIVHLLVKKYLKELFVPSSYSTNVYLVTGNQASLYTRFSREEVLARSGRIGARKLEISFVKYNKAPRKKPTTTSTAKTTKDGTSSTLPQKRTSTDRKGKGKAAAAPATITGEDGADGGSGGGSESGEYIDPDEGLEGYVSSDDIGDSDSAPLPRPNRYAVTPPHPRSPLHPTPRFHPRRPRSRPHSRVPSTSGSKAAANSSSSSSKLIHTPRALTQPRVHLMASTSSNTDNNNNRARAALQGEASAIEVISISDDDEQEGSGSDKVSEADDDDDDDEEEEEEEEDDDDGVDHEWMFNQRGMRGPPPRKKARSSGGGGQVLDDDGDTVITLSD